MRNLHGRFRATGFRALIVSFSAVLGACATQCPSPPPPQVHTRVIDTACGWLPALTFAPADTDATKQEIIGYTLARRRNCPAVSSGGHP